MPNLKRVWQQRYDTVFPQEWWEKGEHKMKIILVEDPVCFLFIFLLCLLTFYRVRRM